MTDVPASSGPPTQLAERLDRLITAANDLATTIARTERIAARAADVVALRPGTHPREGSGDGAHSAAGPERLVTLAEVARRTGRHPDLLRRWCLDGRLEGVRVGRAWCLPERSIGRLGRFQRRRHGAPTRARQREEASGATGERGGTTGS